ncbi:YaaR family protein [Priestia endophytica]|uniref:YaaR family protein n=1 Tax=Priestia endophytica TaxID=135735 RepID=UPI00228260A5|nr:YaaR family protein [Priestia endophytica]MCY8233842.1 YaaR family protein [Priestia endophytica]
MKINQDAPLYIEQDRQQSQKVTSSPLKFQDLVGKQANKLQLQQLMAGIEDQGQRLARSQTLREMAKYKMLIRRFIKEAVEFGLDLKDSRSFSYDGQTQKLTTVEEIDEKLMELTKDITNQQADSISLLKKLGEIKGLLINLYM